MRFRILLKLVAALAVFIAIALVATDFLTRRVVEPQYMAHRWRELEDKARILQLTNLSALADPVRLHEIAQASGTRITLISRDGQVMADSATDISNLDNHARRPEVTEALSGKTGRSIRGSTSTGVERLYLAVPIPQGVLRLSIPLSEIAHDDV